MVHYTTHEYLERTNKEIDNLKSEITSGKEESQNIEEKIEELQEKFLKLKTRIENLNDGLLKMNLDLKRKQIMPNEKNEILSNYRIISVIVVDDERNKLLSDSLVHVDRDILMRLIKIMHDRQKTRNIIGMIQKFYLWSKLRIFRWAMSFSAYHRKRLPPTSPARDSAVTLLFAKGETLKKALAGRSNTSIRAVRGAVPMDVCGALPNLEYADLRETGWEKINGYSFSGMEMLRRVEFPAELKVIATRAFGGVCALTEVWFPEGLRVVDRQAFGGCELLQEVAFPPGFETLGYCAFERCPSLRRVELPSAMKRIEGDVFDDCAALEMFVVGDVDEWVCEGLGLGKGLSLKELRLIGRKWETIPACLAHSLADDARVIGPNFVGKNLGKFIVKAK